MATANDVIHRAARRLGVIGSEEALTGPEGADALAQLNDMLHGFGSQGIYYAHTTLAAADTLNVPDEQIRNVMLMLCREMADEYEVTISIQLAAAIADAKQALQAAYPNDNPAVVDRALRPRGESFDFSRGR